jgi:hypothetical protein
LIRMIAVPELPRRLNNHNDAGLTDDEFSSDSVDDNRESSIKVPTNSPA